MFVTDTGWTQVSPALLQVEAEGHSQTLTVPGVSSVPELPDRKTQP